MTTSTFLNGKAALNPKKNDGCQITLADCIKRKQLEYHSSSAEYKAWIEALQDMIIDTTYPSAMLDNPSFRARLHSYDPRCQLITLQLKIRLKILF